MADTIFVRLRVEYKGPDKDVDTPAPVSVQLAKGSTVLDLLNMAEHHDARQDNFLFLKPYYNSGIMSHYPTSVTNLTEYSRNVLQIRELSS